MTSNKFFDISEHPALAGAVAAVPTEGSAAAIEGLGRGLFTKGFSSVEKGAGGASAEEIQARAAAHPKTAAVSEFLGEGMRGIATYTLAGPAALYANAALNTAGQTADEAYDHDPSLTREHVAQTALLQTLSAGLAHGSPAVLAGISATGKAVMGSATKWGSKLLTESPQLAKIARAGGLPGLAEKALQDGIFTQGRAAGMKAAKESLRSIGSKMGVLQDMADSAAAVPPAEGGDPVEMLIIDSSVAGCREATHSRQDAGRCLKSEAVGRRCRQRWQALGFVTNRATDRRPARRRQEKE